MTNEYEELHQVEFEMLLEIRRICEKYELTYYLSGGTFLGAVRHGGFIPWDDDMDIALPREDYQKFAKIANKELPEGIVFKSVATDPDYHVPWARLENEKVKVLVHTYSKPKIESAWIDIFPLDGMPDNKFFAYLRKMELLWRRVTIGWANYKDIQDIRPGRPWYEKFLMFIGRTIKPGRFMDLNTQYIKLEKALMKCPAATSKVYMNFNGAYRFNSIMDKEFYYGEGALYPFNGEQFPAPANYNAYLTKIYGDYMSLPPEEKRNKHCTEIYSETKNNK